MMLTNTIKKVFVCDIFSSFTQFDTFWIEGKKVFPLIDFPLSLSLCMCVWNVFASIINRFAMQCFLWLNCKDKLSDIGRLYGRESFRYSVQSDGFVMQCLSYIPFRKWVQINFCCFVFLHWAHHIPPPIQFFLLLYATIHWPDNNENINHRSCPLVPFSSSQYLIIIKQAANSNKHSHSEIKVKYINKIHNQLLCATCQFFSISISPLSCMATFFSRRPFFSFFFLSPRVSLISFPFLNWSH